MRVAVFTSGVSAKDPKTTLDPKFDENVIDRDNDIKFFHYKLLIQVFKKLYLNS